MIDTVLLPKLPCLQDANEFFLVLGLVGLVMYGVLACGIIRISELKLLSLSFVISAAGCCVLVRVRMSNLIAGCVTEFGQ